MKEAEALLVGGNPLEYRRGTHDLRAELELEQRRREAILLQVAQRTPLPLVPRLVRPPLLPARSLLALLGECNPDPQQSIMVVRLAPGSCDSSRSFSASTSRFVE